MPADRLLGTLLRSLQTYTDQQDTPRLLGTTASLLTTLNNPLNVTLLTSQLLSAPAIWAYPEGLRTCMRCLSVFHSAAQALLKHEASPRDRTADQDFTQLQLERTLPKDEWIRAVVSGADEHSPRWRHVLVLGGLLLGFGPREDESLSRSMRATLETGFVTAVNASLQEFEPGDELGQQAVTAIVNHCFPLLRDHERAQLDYDVLCPALVQAWLHSSEGLQSAYFLGAIDVDVRPASNTQFRWPESSRSFQLIQAMLSSPLIGSLGPLARLVGHAVENVRDPSIVLATMTEFESFSRSLYMQWRQIKLSEIDASEEAVYLTPESLERTVPALWKLFRSTLYAVVIILRSIIGRMLGDSRLGADNAAPRLVAQALHTLRYLSFISSRAGSSAFSQYTFVYLTAMDILATYPQEAEAFLQAIRPGELSTIPRHPLERSLDLFFLNTAEHFTLVLPQRLSEELVLAAATPYLAPDCNNNLLPIFEAAHSLILAAFSAPQNTALTAKHLPFYVEALFRVFPSNLSMRQFRLAFKTLVRLTAPPSPLSATQPMLPVILLDLLHERAIHASQVPLFPEATSTAPDGPPEALMELSEQTVLTLTIIDTLTHLPLELLKEWLPLTAEMVNRVDDFGMREHCKEHFWALLVGGEMDPDQSQLCAGWWSTAGGKELLLYGQENHESDKYTMSGALPSSDDSKL
ncbi:hypothetical protein LTR78_003924 [Recurvomyces mirabilis]|uniref:Peroxisomal membrane protein Pex17 n=1 Tax=Recurvomyces mirabilis TaxID=574656 RepID=A0AAE0WQK5_9PEZI|nr:hypothetical protein LTR78_003924 [Recurvomyces mirabilis]KAK5153938.1 hypothetical protein LTS14_007158 [Recurvomyces mirabilis]